MRDRARVRAAGELFESPSLRGASIVYLYVFVFGITLDFTHTHARASAATQETRGAHSKKRYSDTHPGRLSGFNLIDLLLDLFSLPVLELPDNAALDDANVPGRETIEVIDDRAARLRNGNDRDLLPDWDPVTDLLLVLNTDPDRP